MSYAPPLACRRCGATIPREGDRAHECPSCGDVPPLQEVSLDA